MTVLELIGFGEDLFNQLPETPLTSSASLQIACSDTASFAYSPTTRVRVPKRKAGDVALDSAAANATALYQWGTYFYEEGVQQQRAHTKKRPSTSQTDSHGNKSCAGELELV
jgi:hypothetical protein